MKQRFTIYSIMLCLLTMCMHTHASADSRINVFVSISPQRYFVNAIGREFIKTTVIVTPDHSPADYEPSPSQMMMMAKADIYFAVGVPFESMWLTRFTGVNPDMKIVHTDAKIEKRCIDRHENSQKPDGHDQTHDHGAMDPHIWLSPPMVKIQAEHILNGLILIDPERRKIYEKNYAQFITRIESLDKELKTLFSKDTRQKKFLVFHPSWGYFADAYGLTQISIEIEGKNPKAREVKNLIEFARQQHIQIIFVQPRFSTKQAKIIAHEINGQMIVADPLAENWVDNIRAVAMSIKQGLR